MNLNVLHGLLEEIDLRRIRPSRNPLRVNVGQIDELVSSIMQDGLLQPLVVRPTDDGEFEVVAGNRRLAACKMLRIKTVPCHVAEFDDKESYETSLIENIQRKTLDPLEEARAFNNYVKEYGYGSASELARRIGKSCTYVSRRIALLGLPKNVQEQLLRGAKVGIAQELLSLDDEKQREAVGQLVINGEANREEIRYAIREIKNKSAQDSGLLLPTPFYSSNLLEEKRRRAIDKAFAKYITSFRICMMRLDEVLDSLDKDEWVLRSALMLHRRSVHQQIDSLMKLRKRTMYKLPPKSE
jgi:ParB family chromosome partitioning protein